MTEDELHNFLVDIDKVLYPFCVWYFALYVFWSLL